MERAKRGKVSSYPHEKKSNIASFVLLLKTEKDHKVFQLWQRTAITRIMCKSSSTLVLVVSGFMALTRAKNHATFLLFPSSHNTNAAAICHKKWHSSQGKLDWNIGFSSRAKESRFISQNFVFFSWILLMSEIMRNLGFSRLFYDLSTTTQNVHFRLAITLWALATPQKDTFLQLSCWRKTCCIIEKCLSLLKTWLNFSFFLNWLSSFLCHVWH